MHKLYGISMKHVFRILAVIFCIMAAYAVWLDLTNTHTASVPLGQFWYSHNPGSLQLAESLVSRFIDPCSFIIKLNCSPFLWHPFISTVLGWPAALVLLGLCVIFHLVSLWLGGSKSGYKPRSRSLKRLGEK